MKNWLNGAVLIIVLALSFFSTGCGKKEESRQEAAKDSLPPAQQEATGKLPAAPPKAGQTFEGTLTKFFAMNPKGVGPEGMHVSFWLAEHSDLEFITDVATAVKCGLFKAEDVTSLQFFAKKGLSWRVRVQCSREEDAKECNVLSLQVLDLTDGHPSAASPPASRRPPSATTHSSSGSASADRELTVNLAEGVMIKFAFIPAGKLVMGSPISEENRLDDEGPQHNVTFRRGFYMSIYELTREQFAFFALQSSYKTDAEKSGSSRHLSLGTLDWRELKGGSWSNPGFAQTEKHPVVCVSFRDASEFCDWASKKTGKRIRLPTEAEWEYACRAGTKSAYQWGDSPDDGMGWCNALDKTFCDKAGFWVGSAFNWEDGYVGTSPVGRLNPTLGVCMICTGMLWNAAQIGMTASIIRIPPV